MFNLNDICTVKTLKKISMATFIFIIVLLHLAAGFGYLIYKLSTTKKSEESVTNIETKKNDKLI